MRMHVYYAILINATTPLAQFFFLLVFIVFCAISDPNEWHSFHLQHTRPNSAKDHFLFFASRRIGFQHQNSQCEQDSNDVTASSKHRIRPPTCDWHTQFVHSQNAARRKTSFDWKIPVNHRQCGWNGAFQSRHNWKLTNGISMIASRYPFHSAATVWIFYYWNM